jgi:hypothetical protein
MWPDDSVAVFREALRERTLAAAVAESDAMAACEPNFWVPRAAIEAVRAAARSLLLLRSSDLPACRRRRASRARWRSRWCASCTTV